MTMYYDTYFGRITFNDNSRFMHSSNDLLGRVNNIFYVGVDPLTHSLYTIQESTQQNEEIMETENTEMIEENTGLLEPLIPENSRSILVDEYTSRFSGAIWYDKIQQLNVILGGAGGISSYVGFLLSRLRVNRITVFDPDIVEAVNISGQFYSTSDIGKLKVQALSSLVANFSNYYSVAARNELYDEDTQACPIMICGFDNMVARKVFFNNWLKYVRSGNTPPEKCFYQDGRLAAEEFQIFSIQGNDERAIKEYQDKWLFSDAEAEETICSYKQTTFMANMIASMMVNVFVNFAANNSNPAPIIPRDIPFFISYSADTMFTKIEM